MQFQKRVRGSPTGLTPQKPCKVVRRSITVPNAGRRQLVFGSSKLACDDHGAGWTIAEEASLVSYIVERGFVSFWPKSRASNTMWEAASSFLMKRGHRTKRTSK